jgi:hypothetical protein
MKLLHLILLSALFSVSSAFSSEPKTVRVLSIGNSFSRNATQHLQGIVDASSHQLIHTDLVIGGASFEVHHVKSQQPDKARLYNDGKDLVTHLQSQPWDIVTIQQASIKSHDYGTFQPHANALADLVRQHAPQARLHIHQTWPYRADDPRFTKPSSKPGEPQTQTEMYHGLTAAYNRLAAELNATVIPVGDAFFLADSHPEWGFRPDLDWDRAVMRAPNLPAQTNSLHVGWRWTTKDGKQSLGMDGHHANLAGQFLGACVWFEMLFNESTLNNSFVPKGLDPAHATFLRSIAHQAVETRRQTSPTAAP